MIYQVEVNTIGVFWRVDGKEHRGGGLPAIEHHNGDKFWFVNGVPHREDGPAVICSDERGSQWFINGKRHREDGPAVICGDHKAWYINGVYLTEDEFNDRVAKTTKEMTVADIEAILGHKVKIVNGL